MDNENRLDSIEERLDMIESKLEELFEHLDLTSMQVNDKAVPPSAHAQKHKKTQFASKQIFNGVI